MTLVARLNDSVIISLLGVSAVPVEKDRAEEMVSRSLSKQVSVTCSPCLVFALSGECFSS